MKPLHISTDTALKLSEKLGMPIERIMHLPQHILIQRLLELEESEKSKGE